MPKACQPFGIREQASVTCDAVCHRAKFIYQEGASLVTGSLLFEENRSPYKNADKNRSYKNDGGKNDECDKGEAEIKKTLAERHACILPFL